MRNQVCHLGHKYFVPKNGNNGLGVCHTVLKIWTAIKLFPEDGSGAKGINLPLLGKALNGRWALFLIGLAAIGCGLVGTFSWHVSQ